PKLILAVAAAELYRIHTLTDKVEAQSSRPHILERAAAHLLRIRGHTGIFQHNFKSIFGFAVSGRMNPAEGSLDGLFRVSQVGMANNVCQRFVDGTNHRTAIRLRKSP